jgi:hypothetical protein
MDLVAELDALIEAFDADGVEYALCGGLALAVHGHARATQDIDVLVPVNVLERALATARRCGFDVPARKMTFGLKTGEPREIHRVSKIDAATSETLALDVVVVSAQLEPVWQGREDTRSGLRRLVVVSRDGLATMKRIAGRAQDLADIGKLEGNDDET